MTLIFVAVRHLNVLSRSPGSWLWHLFTGLFWGRIEEFISSNLLIQLYILLLKGIIEFIFLHSWEEICVELYVIISSLIWVNSPVLNTCKYGRAIVNRCVITCVHTYRGADKSLARPGRNQANVSVRMSWISFAPYLEGGNKNLMTARISMLLKSRAFLTCFWACFLPGRAKDVSAPWYLPTQLTKQPTNRLNATESLVRIYPFLIQKINPPNITSCDVISTSGACHWTEFNWPTILSSVETF